MYKTTKKAAVSKAYDADNIFEMPIFMSPEDRLFNRYVNQTKCPPSEYEDRQGIVPIKSYRSRY